MAKSYAKIFADTTNKKAAENLVIPFFTPKENEPIIGLLKGIEIVQNEKVKEPCNRYIVDTGEGELSLLMGSATDAQVAGKLNIGWIVYFEFKGKVAIAGTTKSVNRWIVQQVPNE